MYYLNDAGQADIISEGLLTVVFGVISFFILPRTPETTKYLSTDEKAAIVAAHDADRQLKGQKEEESFSWAGVASAFRAPQMWLMFIQFFCSGGMSISTKHNPLIRL